MRNPTLSILDLVPVREGDSPRKALGFSLELARRAEQLGYARFWIAEHHNLPGAASAATAVVVGHLAAGTERIRVGAGGIMLPNHSPLVVAEQFGTLESLHPGRIDLGLGRAPGTDMRTLRALRRHADHSQNFPEDVEELRSLLAPSVPGQAVRAIPGEGTRVPLWILSSSLVGASLAARLGLPYAFASHFAPQALHAALALYRKEFRPSTDLARPRVMAGLNVVAADTDAEARRLFTSHQLAFALALRKQPGRFPAPVARIEDLLPPEELSQVAAGLACSVVGSPATVREGVERFLGETGADELMVVGHIHDPKARARSFEILMAAASGA
jgi:luciferase family oxidoreductase group 1